MEIGKKREGKLSASSEEMAWWVTVPTGQAGIEGISKMATS